MSGEEVEEDLQKLRIFIETEIHPSLEAEVETTDLEETQKRDHLEKENNPHQNKTLMRIFFFILRNNFEVPRYGANNEEFAEAVRIAFIIYFSKI